MSSYRFRALGFLMSLVLLVPAGHVESKAKNSSLRDLPSAAQAAISNVLGHDDAAFAWNLNNQS